MKPKQWLWKNRRRRQKKIRRIFLSSISFVRFSMSYILFYRISLVCVAFSFLPRKCLIICTAFIHIRLKICFALFWSLAFVFAHKILAIFTVAILAQRAVFFHSCVAFIYNGFVLCIYIFYTCSRLKIQSYLYSLKHFATFPYIVSVAATCCWLHWKAHLPLHNNNNQKQRIQHILFIHMFVGKLCQNCQV